VLTYSNCFGECRKRANFAFKQPATRAQHIVGIAVYAVDIGPLTGFYAVLKTNLIPESSSATNIVLGLLVALAIVYLTTIVATVTASLSLPASLFGERSPEVSYYLTLRPSEDHPSSISDKTLPLIPSITLLVVLVLPNLRSTLK
jgi:hypothetical protein